MRQTIWILATCLLASVASGGELLVDDFEDGDLESELGLAWMIIADDLIGGSSDGQLEMSTAVGVRSAVLRGERRPSEAMPITFLGAWTAVGEDGLARDLSEYEGVRIRARAAAGSFQAGLRRAGASANYSAPIELGPQWTDVEVSFTALRPLVAPGTEAPEWSAADATWVGISSSGFDSAAVELEIDRIAFYGGPSAQRAPASEGASGSATATVQLLDAASLESLSWQPLAREDAGDALRPGLPDAVALAWASGPEDRIWFRVSLADDPPSRWMGVNVALDVNGDAGDGMAWWGSNSAFHFDELVTAYLTRTDTYWMGAVGVASAEDVGRGVMDGRTADVVAAVDRPNRYLLVGVPRQALPESGTVRLIATVGSSMVNNDDLPSEGAVVLELPPIEGR